MRAVNRQPGYRPGTLRAPCCIIIALSQPASACGGRCRGGRYCGGRCQRKCDMSGRPFHICEIHFRQTLNHSIRNPTSPLGVRWFSGTSIQESFNPLFPPSQGRVYPPPLPLPMDPGRANLGVSWPPFRGPEPFQKRSKNQSHFH